MTKLNWTKTLDQTEFNKDTWPNWIYQKHMSKLNKTKTLDQTKLNKANWANLTEQRPNRIEPMLYINDRKPSEKNKFLPDKNCKPSAVKL